MEEDKEDISVLEVEGKIRSTLEVMTYIQS